jgi:hypothetical protein
VTSVTLSSAGAAGTALVAGSPYDITPSAAVGSGLANYDVHYVKGKLTVGLRTLTITANDRSKTYGDAVNFAGTEFSTNAGGLVNGDSVTSVTLGSAGAPATAEASAVPYAISATNAQGTGLANYAIGYVDGKLTVGKRTLTVTADSKTKLLNAPNPTLTGTVTGIQNNDPITVTYTTSATQSSPVGGYVITPVVTSTPSTVLTTNYTVVTNPATLRILFAWDGFLQPINDTAHQVGTYESKFKLGQTIPVKFDLKDANGVVVTQSTAPWFTRSDYMGPCDVDAQTDAVPTVAPDGQPTYVLTGGHYQYNWSTKGMSKPGEYRIYANLADGNAQSVYICLTK